MTPEEKLNLIYSRLPKGAREIVESDPKRQKEVHKIVDKIFKDYGEDIKKLSNN